MSITNDISIINCDPKLNYNFLLKDNITLPCYCPDIVKVVKSVFIPKIYKISLVISPSTDGINNFKGESLNGYKLKVYGIINSNISYISSKEASIKSINKEIPFVELVPIYSKEKVKSINDINASVRKDILCKINNRELFICLLINLGLNE